MIVCVVTVMKSINSNLKKILCFRDLPGYESWLCANTLSINGILELPLTCLPRILMYSLAVTDVPQWEGHKNGSLQETETVSHRVRRIKVECHMFLASQALWSEGYRLWVPCFCYYVGKSPKCLTKKFSNNVFFVRFFFLTKNSFRICPRWGNVLTREVKCFLFLVISHLLKWCSVIFILWDLWKFIQVREIRLLWF